MTLFVAVLAGLGTGVGLMLVMMGLRGVDTQPQTATNRLVPPVLARLAHIDRFRLRVFLGAGAALAMAFLAPWPVAVLLAGLAGFSSPTIAGAAKRRKAAVAKTEAIATWAEQLRDTIGSAAGLQEAISVTSRVAPKEIRGDVQTLARGMRRQPLPQLLREFALGVDDPAADQVAVALIMASQRRGQNLTVLLSDVADAAREEATMRMRTETSRAQTYSDAKAVTGIVLGVFFLLLMLNRGYLSAFDSFTGQVVLAVVGVMWAAAVYALAELSKVRRPPRILSLDAVGSR